MTVAIILMYNSLPPEVSRDLFRCCDGLKVKAISPSCPQSLSEEMLPTAAVMEEQLQEATQSSL